MIALLLFEIKTLKKISL